MSNNEKLYSAANSWADQLNTEFMLATNKKEVVTAFDVYSVRMDERYIDTFFKNRAGGWRSDLDIEDREALVKIIEADRSNGPACG